MFGIGMPEVLIILAVALIVIGPKKLPDLAKSLGRAIGEFKKATREFKQSVEINGELKDVKETVAGMNESIKEAVDDVSTISDNKHELVGKKAAKGSLKND